MNNQSSIVRRATMEDYDEVWRLFILCFEENGLMPTYSHAKTDYFIRRFLDQSKIEEGDTGPRGVIGVIGEVGRLEGCICLSIGSPWYSDDVTIDEFLNFVDPEHRDSEHAKTMIAYAKHIIDLLLDRNPDVKLTIGVLSTSRTAAKVRLYERQLTPAGAFFIYPPPADVAPPKHLYRTRQ